MEAAGGDEVGPQLTGQHQQPHPPVCCERPQRICERCGSVPLYEEVRRPGEGIAADKGGNEQRGPGPHRRRRGEDRCERGAGEVEPPGEGAGVLIKVERPELREGGDPMRGDHPGPRRAAEEAEGGEMRPEKK